MKFLLLTTNLIFSFFCFSTIRYVTLSGASNMDGSSWTNAASGMMLQQIINLSQNGDEVWIACGTYYPTNTLDRTISFSMKNGVQIYGSFTGTETNLNQRNLTCGSCSILSGEIGNAGSNDNSFKVISNIELDNTAILDGFIIENGNDDRSPTSFGNGLGGGIYNHGYGISGYCHPIYRNCIIQNNFASWGAGAFNNGYDSGNTQATYINCIFTKNHAYIEAGGMDSYGVKGNASPSLYNCLFYENTSATNVGAMYCWGGSNGQSNPTLINCAFINNTAQNGYAGAFIADNSNEDLSGSSGVCNVTLQNCIVWDNSASTVGQQFYIKGTGAQINATYSNIDLSSQTTPHILSGSITGNTTLDPNFIDISNAIGVDNCWKTADDGLYFQTNSPNINSGNNANVYTSDITNISNRILNSIVEIGPYEQNQLSVLVKQFNSKTVCYPNPSDNKLTIDFGNQMESGILKILDFKGTVLREIKFDDKKNLPLNLDLASGIYLLEINFENLETEKIKIVIN